MTQRAGAVVEVLEEGSQAFRGPAWTKQPATRPAAASSRAWRGAVAGVRSGNRCRALCADRVRAFPHRGQDGTLSLRSTATEAMRSAIADGAKWMSVEFIALRERTTKAGVREILSAMVPRAALVSTPEYDTTAAEVRSARRARRRRWQR